jgi:hypothetical protein
VSTLFSFLASSQDVGGVVTSVTLRGLRGGTPSWRASAHQPRIRPGAARP